MSDATIGMRRGLMVGVALATSMPVYAQQTQTPSNTTPAETSKPDEPARLVVQGEKPESITQIDRKTYDIANDPKAQSGTALDILGTLPSVSISPTGNIQLLGNLGATLQIDGRPQINADQALKTLLASDIDRIEVMTNPSAQFASNGAGGIINIITKHKRAPGLTGSVLTSGDTFGGAQLSFSPAITVDAWTLTAKAQYARNARIQKSARRTEMLDGTGAVLANSRAAYTSDSYSGKLGATYALSDKSRFGVSWESTYGQYQDDTRIGVISSIAGRPSFTETSHAPNRYRSNDVTADYEVNGPTDNDSLKISASFYSSNSSEHSAFRDVFEDAIQPDQAYATFSQRRFEYSTIKLDVKQAVFTTDILSWGASWDRELTDEHSSLESIAGLNPSLPTFSRTLKGYRDVAAGYATFQFPLEKWTILPGLRAEVEDVNVAGLALSAKNAIDVFPTLHVTRDLTDSLSLGFSYSKRIDRPNIGNLDPTPVYTGATSGSVGNPDLKPSSVVSTEASATYSHEKLEASAILYSREQSDVWTFILQESDEGVLLSTLINAGRQTNQGAELALKDAIAEGWNYSVSADLYALGRDVLEDGVRRRETNFAYSGKAKLEYRWREQGFNEDNQVELATQYYGPRRSLQSEYGGNSWADLTWRRPLTDRASIVFTVSDVFGTQRNRLRYTTDTLFDETRFLGPTTRLKISLTYKLGADK